MRSSLVLLFSAALTCSAQAGLNVSFGVKAGVPATDAPFQYGTLTGKARWTAGPAIEVRLSHHLSVELDALYRGADIQIQSVAGSSLAPTVFWSTGTTRAWDFPVLLKYRILDGPTRPFVSAGFSGIHESADLTGSCSGPLCLLPTDQTASAWKSVVNTNRIGATVAAGLEFSLGRIKIAPELRFTRVSHPNGNMVDLLVGFTF